MMMTWGDDDAPPHAQVLFPVRRGATEGRSLSRVWDRAQRFWRAGIRQSAGQRDSPAPHAPTCSITDAQTCSIKRERSIAVTAVHRAVGE